MNQLKLSEITHPRIADEEFLEQFETCRLPGECFHHPDHVRLAWLYLRRYPLLEALAKFTEGLRRFALSKGQAGLYHETITLAYLFLIHERLRRSAVQQSWREFASANADLLDWQDNILKKLYRRETLFSDFAREVFVFPDQPASAMDGAANSAVPSPG
jgi:hypothetical protein